VLSQQAFGDDQAENTVAEEFEPVIVAALFLGAIIDAAVRDCFTQQLTILEHIADALFELGEPRILPAQFTDFRKRSPRKPVNKVHGRTSEVVSSHETTTNCAGPTRLSYGTKPTTPVRLSAELSRSSPIMK
jgi:hypothetical protein